MPSRERRVGRSPATSGGAGRAAAPPRTAAAPRGERPRRGPSATPVVGGRREKVLRGGLRNAPSGRCRRGGGGRRRGWAASRDCRGRGGGRGRDPRRGGA